MQKLKMALLNTRVTAPESTDGDKSVDDIEEIKRLEAELNELHQSLYNLEEEFTRRQNIIHAEIKARIKKMEKMGIKETVSVTDLSGISHNIEIDEKSTGATLIRDVIAELGGNPRFKRIELYTDGGQQITKDRTLKAQGVDCFTTISLVLPEQNEPFTDINFKHELARWFDPVTHDAVVEEFGEIGDWNVSKVKDMNGLFYNKILFNEDISNWDTSSVITMRSMFHHCRAFNQNLSAWDVQEVTDMACIFCNARAFDQPGTLDDWAPDKVTDWYHAFSKCPMEHYKPNWYPETTD